MKKYLILLLLIIPWLSFWLDITDSEVLQIEQIVRQDFEEATWYDITHAVEINREHDRRWSCSNTRLLINPERIKTREELVLIIAHELWHALQYSMNSSTTYSNIYTDFWLAWFSLDNPFVLYSSINREDEYNIIDDSYSVSRYGRYDIHENFSESLVYYLFAREAFKEKARHSNVMLIQYNLMNRLFNWYYYADWDASWAYKDTWDTTLLYN